jgi:hypothetical protein
MQNFAPWGFSAEQFRQCIDAPVEQVTLSFPYHATSRRDYNGARMLRARLAREWAIESAVQTVEAMQSSRGPYYARIAGNSMVVLKGWPDSKSTWVNGLRRRRGRTACHAAKVDEAAMTVLRFSGSTTRKPVIAAAPASAAAQR